MANFVADTLELQDPTNGYMGTISAGGLDSIPTVRGEDDIVPGASGRVTRTRVGDSLPVVIHMLVMGSGSTHDAIAESYLTRMTALKDVFDPTADPFTLTIHPTAKAVGGKVASGKTATIKVRCLRFVGPPAIGDEVREFDIECESVDSPPVWVIA